MQAMILAAGLGRRLGQLTAHNTKAMVAVNGVMLIKRMLEQLDAWGFSRIVIVVGYERDKLISYIADLNIATPVEYVINPVADKTNNIYSLFLARHYLEMDDTLLLESDLIFDSHILNCIIDNPYPNLALVDKFENWMDGTVVVLDDDDNIKKFVPKNDFEFQEMDTYYKTVNIYKFSKEFSHTHYVPFLEAYCKAMGNNEYYEQVLKIIANLDTPAIKAIRLDRGLWYEIDDIQDLDIAESIFAPNDEILERMKRRYGGYWRYPHILDFCHLVNPYFPPSKLIAELKANFEKLINAYPSGMGVNSLLAAKYFGLSSDYVCVGNGATELINALLLVSSKMRMMEGKFGIALPSFEEYPNRLGQDRIVAFYSSSVSFSYSTADIKTFYEKREKENAEKIHTLILVNPDNPSGNFIDARGLADLIEWTKNKAIKLIVDESFVDFSYPAGGKSDSLLDEEILRSNKHLTVVRSLSQSFGVPGLRLGIAASGDSEVIERLRRDVSIWNINSFAEFFLQIFEKYRVEYKASTERLIYTRDIFVKKLKSISGIHVYPSHANYITVELQGPINARNFASRLLRDHGILVKDLSKKNGIEGLGFLRLSVRNVEDNDRLISAMRKVLGQ
jgi:histidinol-phosphate/aromatic aminotransferase/cobyric acid decarboxylase-like protein/GTP:adenosylcobinamide-phosphate guanylyltransferase